MKIKTAGDLFNIVCVQASLTGTTKFARYHFSFHRAMKRNHDYRITEIFELE